MLAHRNVTSVAVQNWENEWFCWSTVWILSVHVTCLGKQDYWSLSAKSKLNPDKAPQNAAKSRGVDISLQHVETCSGVFFHIYLYWQSPCPLFQTSGCSPALLPCGTAAGK